MGEKDKQTRKNIMGGQILLGTVGKFASELGARSPNRQKTTF